MANELPMRFASRSNTQNPLPYRLSQHSLAKPIRKTAANAHAAGQRSKADKVSQKLHVICRRLSFSLNLSGSAKNNWLIEKGIGFWWRSDLQRHILAPKRKRQSLPLNLSSRIPPYSLLELFEASYCLGSACSCLGTASSSRNTSGFRTINRRRSFSTTPRCISTCMARETVSRLVLTMIEISC